MTFVIWGTELYRVLKTTPKQHQAIAQAVKDGTIVDRSQWVRRIPRDRVRPATEEDLETWKELELTEAKEIHAISEVRKAFQPGIRVLQDKLRRIP